MIKEILFAFPSSLHKGKRRDSLPQQLGKPLDSVWFSAVLFGHQSLQIKSSGPARNMKNNSSLDSLLQLAVRKKRHEITPMFLVPWPACFMSPSPSSHFSLLPLFSHLGYINGEMVEEPQQLFGKLS